MKFLIASDVHGSGYYAEKLVERMKEEKADKMTKMTKGKNVPGTKFPEEG